MRQLILASTSVTLVMTTVQFTVSCSDRPMTGPSKLDIAQSTPSAMNMVVADTINADAALPRTGTGTWTVTNFTLISRREVGENIIIDNSVELAWEGALVGTSIHFNRIVRHNATGMATFQNTGEFTGTLVGCANVKAFAYKSSATADTLAGTGEGTTRIVASNATTGALLSGVIRWSQVGNGGPYVIEYVC